MTMERPTPPFALTDSERANPGWHRLCEHMTSRIGRLHVQLEAPQTEEKTAELRGLIKAYRELLALNKSPPPGL